MHNFVLPCHGLHGLNQVHLPSPKVAEICVLDRISKELCLRYNLKNYAWWIHENNSCNWMTMWWNVSHNFFEIVPKLEDYDVASTSEVVLRCSNFIYYTYWNISILFTKWYYNAPVLHIPKTENEPIFPKPVLCLIYIYRLKLKCISLRHIQQYYDVSFLHLKNMFKLVALYIYFNSKIMILHVKLSVFKIYTLLKTLKLHFILEHSKVFKW